MARIALIDAAPGILTSLEAVTAGCELVACDRHTLPADVDLLIVDCGDSAPADDMIALANSGAPALLLVDRRVNACEALSGSRTVALLRKPFDLLELRLKLRELLDAAPALVEQPAPTAAATQLDWLRTPLVPASVVPTLEAALHLRGSLLLAGESGTGRQRVAGSLLQRRRPSLSLVSWHPGEDLSWLLRRMTGADDKNALGLFVADIDARPLSEQRRLEELLSMQPDVIVVATAGEDPAQAVVAGTLSRSLYHLLARVAVRLPPLRERRSDIAALAQLFADAVTAQCRDGAAVTFTDAAWEKLELYPWPANLPELEGVVTRSVIAATASMRAAACVIDAPDLSFAPALSAVSLAQAASAVSVRRSAVVLPLAATDAPAVTAPGMPMQSPTAIEPVLAGLAHDLRNPMTTLKTFAALAAQQEGVDAGSAELAREAVSACTRIDAHLELLNDYAALTSPEAGEIDLVAVFAEAIEEARLPVAASVHARQALWARVDESHARFIATALLDESRERLGEHDEAWVDVADSGSAVEIRIPRGGRAIERLGRWLEEDAWPWRLALAREVARRGGGELELDVEEEELRARWRAPLGEEVRNGQADRIDRRRRSRSS